MNSQPQLPAMPPDWTCPVEIGFTQLAATITAAERDGFDAVRMTVKPGKYVVAFQRKPASATTDAPQRTCECCRHWLFVTDEAGQCVKHHEALTASNQTCPGWQPKNDQSQPQARQSAGRGAVESEAGGKSKESFLKAKPARAIASPVNR